MANISRYDPFRELTRFDPFRDLDDMFGMPRTRGSSRNVPQEPEIRLDLTEDDEAYHVKAEIPGVRKEDIEISIEGSQVSISAEVKKQKEEKKGERVIRSERYYGSQFRGFTLQHAIDEGKADAKYENGVLELTLPKKKTATAKQVAVK
jgi:HSP20 family protein